MYTHSTLKLQFLLKDIDKKISIYQNQKKIIKAKYLRFPTTKNLFDIKKVNYYVNKFLHLKHKYSNEMKLYTPLFNYNFDKSKGTLLSNDIVGKGTSYFKGSDVDCKHDIWKIFDEDDFDEDDFEKDDFEEVLQLLDQYNDNDGKTYLRENLKKVKLVKDNKSNVLLTPLY